MVPKKGEASCNSEKSSHSNAWEWFKITYLVDCPYCKPQYLDVYRCFLESVFCRRVFVCMCVTQKLDV